MNNTPNNPINAVLQLLNNGGNPQQLLQNFMQQIPNANTQIQQIQNMVGKQNPKDFAMQLAKQKGIDPKQVEQLANKFGLK